ncbi:hypothetical protein NUBL21982_00940 [Klebsiella pneumoniae]|nr:hypothetical protein NUBL21982_00940 [Klebsiella pneumoniae]
MPGIFFTGVRLSGVVMRRAKKSPSWEMGKDYTQQFVVSLRGFPCLEIKVLIYNRELIVGSGAFAVDQIPLNS